MSIYNRLYGSRGVTAHDALLLIAVKLFREGRTTFELDERLIHDDSLDDMRIEVIRNFDRNNYIVKLHSRNGQPIQDADYEIEVDQQALPSPLKQISSGDKQS